MLIIYVYSTICKCMHSSLDGCYEYSIDNDILFNHSKSICTVFKPKFYNLYQIPTIFIGIESLKYVSKSKYLGLASRTQNMMIVTWCVK